MRKSNYVSIITTTLLLASCGGQESAEPNWNDIADGGDGVETPEQMVTGANLTADCSMNETGDLVCGLIKEKDDQNNILLTDFYKRKWSMILASYPEDEEIKRTEVFGKEELPENKKLQNVELETESQNNNSGISFKLSQSSVWTHFYTMLSEDKGKTFKFYLTLPEKDGDPNNKEKDGFPKAAVIDNCLFASGMKNMDNQKAEIIEEAKKISDDLKDLSDQIDAKNTAIANLDPETADYANKLETLEREKNQLQSNYDEKIAPIIAQAETVISTLQNWSKAQECDEEKTEKDTQLFETTISDILESFIESK